jgi:hypothetical protein
MKLIGRHLTGFVNANDSSRDALALEPFFPIGRSWSPYFQPRIFLGVKIRHPERAPRTRITRRVEERSVTASDVRRPIR